MAAASTADYGDDVDPAGDVVTSLNEQHSATRTSTSSAGHSSCQEDLELHSTLPSHIRGVADVADCAITCHFKTFSELHFSRSHAAENFCWLIQSQ